MVFIIMNKETENILDKVSVLYRKYGIKSITMDDVAHELGISKKTLYQFVGDKTELVEKVVEHTRHCSFAGMKELKEMGGNAIERLIQVSQQVQALLKDHSASYEYDLKKYYPGIFKKLMSARRKLMYEAMLANIRQGKKEGIYRDELDEEIIAKLHLLRMENLQSTELFSEEEIQSPKFFREIFVYHIHGLATSRGLEILGRNIEKLELMEVH
jgi:AcrR family transcriptional regulator